MGQLLEILGRGMNIDTSELIWHWLDTITSKSQHDEQHKRLREIIRYYSDQKADAAEKYIRFYMFEYPDCPKGRLAAAALAIGNNQIHIAQDHLQHIYRHIANNTVALYALGHCFERLGKADQAAAYFQDCLKFKNHLLLPRQRLAAIHYQNNHLDQTTCEYEQLRREYPDNVSQLITLGNLYLIRKDYQRAIDAFNTAIIIHPDNFDSQIDVIEKMIADEQFYQAAQELENQVDIQPHRADLYVRYGDVLAKIGAMDQAIDAYEKALHIRPDYLEATIKLGTLFMRCGEDERAAKKFNASMELNDLIIDAYIGLARARSCGNMAKQAISTLGLAASINQNSILLFGETAKLLFKLSNPENVDYEENQGQIVDLMIHRFGSMLQNNTKNPDLYYRLGMLYLYNGDAQKAAHYMSCAVQTNDTFYRARHKLSMLLYNQGHETEGIKLLTDRHPHDPAFVKLHYQIAVLYCDKIKFASSVMNLERFMEDNYSYTDAAVNISIVLQNLGLLDRATVNWDNLAESTSELFQS